MMHKHNTAQLLAECHIEQSEGKWFALSLLTCKKCSPHPPWINFNWNFPCIWATVNSLSRRSGELSNRKWGICNLFKSRKVALKFKNQLRQLSSYAVRFGLNIKEPSGDFCRSDGGIDFSAEAKLVGWWCVTCQSTQEAMDGNSWGQLSRVALMLGRAFSAVPSAMSRHTYTKQNTYIDSLIFEKMRR